MKYKFFIIALIIISLLLFYYLALNYKEQQPENAKNNSGIKQEKNIVGDIDKIISYDEIDDLVDGNIEIIGVLIRKESGFIEIKDKDNNIQNLKISDKTEFITVTDDGKAITVEYDNISLDSNLSILIKSGELEAIEVFIINENLKPVHK